MSWAIAFDEDEIRLLDISGWMPALMKDGIKDAGLLSSKSEVREFQEMEAAEYCAISALRAHCILYVRE